ncbi:MAG: CCA tRNA nucleotidyltransferase [Candidatus Latescibacteria bacterium]|nr:CCA tRNA nucleotidyltransferase [Candidatus Latescibacterota bacterium]
MMILTTTPITTDHEDCEPETIAPLLQERLSEELKDLCRRIGEVGDAMKMPVYAVGGVPRDVLLGRPTFDLDVVVEGDGIAFAERLVAEWGGRVVPHKRFKTAIVACPDGRKVDVATARRERYEYPAALPVVEPSALTQDLYRRDFTINSMAVQLNHDRYGRLSDFFGGRRDLTLGIIRVLHTLSFIEDPTRILRAVRFEQRYGFRVDSETEHLLNSAVEARILEQVPGQRLRDEILLILKEDDPLPALLRLDRFGVFQAISSQWTIERERLTSLFREIHRTIDWFDLLYPGQRVEGWILYLLGVVEETPANGRMSICRRLNFHKQAMEAVRIVAMEGERIEEHLATQDDLRPSRIYRMLSHVPPDVTLFLMARTTHEVVRRRISLYFDRLQVVRTAISGDDLRQMGIPQGPIYRKILGEVLASRLDGQVQSKEEELLLSRRLWEHLE